MWEANVKNNFLIIDEIAYMGRCETPTKAPVVTTTERVTRTTRTTRTTRFTTTPMPAIMT